MTLNIHHYSITIAIWSICKLSIKFDAFWAVADFVLIQYFIIDLLL